MNINKNNYYKNVGSKNIHINVGSGKEISIKELATLIKKITNYQGDILFDSSKPDGTPRKFLDSSTINNFGWFAKTPLQKGLDRLYRWYLDHVL